MATIQLSQRPLLILAGAVVLHIILISAQVNTTAGIPFIQVITFGTFAEVQRGTMKSFDSVRGVWTNYVALRNAQVENERLKRELQTLQVQFQQERAEAQRTESLRQLLELRKRSELATVASEVIAGPATPEFRDMTIDKGGSDGVNRDMAVISPAGVVGRVILPSPRASRVQMLIDRNAAAGAMIERTRAQGIVIGQGDTLRMDYVSGTSDVKVGDLVVTSGIDKIYPKGFVIGTVEVANRGQGSFYEVTVRPAVDFSRIEEVLVVTTPPPAITAEQIATEAAELTAAAPVPPAAPAAPQNVSAQKPQSRNASPRAAAPRPPTPRNTAPRAPAGVSPPAGNGTAPTPPTTPGNGTPPGQQEARRPQG
jgi:rod shape-determining protein MreC